MKCIKTSKSHRVIIYFKNTPTYYVKPVINEKYITRNNNMKKIASRLSA